ncbi:MAG: glycosyltransferase involved in cell wall biosynthesis [Salibacteraceae bacterium]|jgi:glycosyltransferase involved in cell wall biosynthesis
MKRIASLVTNDLHQDQRMNRICTALVNAGYEVTLIGRKRITSRVLDKKPFYRLRLNCWFERSIFFYGEYNIRLFFHLLFTSYDIINANDLDTILPAIWVAKLKGTKVVYDAHEYFTEQEEIVKRPALKLFWKRIEKYSIPKVDAAITVSQGYADLFLKEYHQKFHIVRNATILASPPENCITEEDYILYQGAVNYGRGLEELLMAMPNVNSTLYICGDGDVLPTLKQLAKNLGIEEKVKFIGFVEPDKLREYTCGAKIGLTLFAKGGLSHWHSLANRFFDYMHAGVPQIAMTYPEYEAFNKKDEVAVLIENIEPSKISDALNLLLSNTELYQKLSRNARSAREHANWQAQEKVLLEVYSKLD